MAYLVIFQGNDGTGVINTNPHGGGMAFAPLLLCGGEEDWQIRNMVCSHMPNMGIDNFVGDVHPSWEMTNQKMSEALVAYALSQNKQFWWIEESACLNVGDIQYRCERLTGMWDLLDEMREKNGWDKLKQ